MTLEQSKQQRNDLLALLQKLLDWEEAMGGWEAPVWDEAREAINEAGGAKCPECDGGMEATGPEGSYLLCPECGYDTSPWDVDSEGGAE